jgi:hypothetical protein
MAPLLLSGLRPFPEDFTTGGWTHSAPIIRFGTWVRWPLSQPPASDERSGSTPASEQAIADVMWRPLQLALAPEMPYSILPVSVQKRYQIAVWIDRTRHLVHRGMPWGDTRFHAATTWIQFRHDAHPADQPEGWLPMRVDFLLPDKDPPREPPFAFLGQSFFQRYSGGDVALSFAKVRYRLRGDGSQIIDPSSHCGDLQIQ